MLNRQWPLQVGTTVPYPLTARGHTLGLATREKAASPGHRTLVDATKVGLRESLSLG